MMPTTAHDEEPAATGCEVVRQRADALLAEYGALMADIAADRDRPDLARRMVTMAVALREVRAAVSGHALADELADAIEARAYRRGRADERAAAVPERRKGRHASRSGVVLKLAPVVAAVALLRRSLARHPAVAAKAAALIRPLAAHKALAAAAGSAVFAGGTAAVLTVTALGPNVTLPWTAGAAPAPAATAYAAAPLPSSSPIAMLVTHPKAKRSAKGAPGLSGSGAQAPPWSPDPDPDSPATSPGPSQSASASAGPAALSLGGVTSLDLSNPLDPQATLTVYASGSGWASWRISTTGPDLDFSQDHGVLQAGQSVTLTVSVDPAQAVDGNTQQVFEVDGQQVTVSLPPLPAPVPSVPDPAASVLPSVVPSL